MSEGESKSRYWPHRISASQIGRKWICDEDSRLSALGLFKWSDTGKKGLPKPIQKGNGLDEWLKQRPKSFDELRVRRDLDELINALNESGDNRITVNMESAKGEVIYIWSDFIGYGAMRFYRGVGVIAHWDDFRTYYNRKEGEKNLWHVEYKGLMSPTWIRFEAPAAKSQVLVTQWVWEPVWKHLGWEVADSTVCEFYDLRNAMFIERRTDEWNETLVLEELDNAFALYSGERKPIPPAQFKCVSCQKRNLCTIIK